MVSSYQIDLVTRFVPLSVFAEVARGVAGDGWSGAMCVCVCVFFGITKSKVGLGNIMCVYVLAYEYGCMECVWLLL